MALKWNNAALIAFCEGQNLEYIDEGLMLITNTMLELSETKKISIKGAKVMAAMFDAACDDGRKGIEMITDPEAIRELTAVFIAAMPRPKPQEAEKKKEPKPYASASLTSSDLDAVISVIQ
jgi:hypothetical protein